MEQMEEDNYSGYMEESLATWSEFGYVELVWLHGASLATWSEFGYVELSGAEWLRVWLLGAVFGYMEQSFSTWSKFGYMDSEFGYMEQSGVTWSRWILVDCYNTVRKRLEFRIRLWE